MRTTPMLITTMVRVWLANNVGSDDHVDSEVNYGKCDRRDGGYDGGMPITVARTMVGAAAAGDGGVDNGCDDDDDTSDDSAHGMG